MLAEVIGGLLAAAHLEGIRPVVASLHYLDFSANMLWLFTLGLSAVILQLCLVLLRLLLLLLAFIF